jgi:hypothetical protein
MASNRNRLAETAHYVIARSQPDRLGAVKLNKVLWYADVIFYRRHGRTITGADTYIKRQLGPVPRDIVQTLKMLEHEGKIFMRKSETPTGTRHEYLWLKKPEVQVFEPEEIDVLHEVIDWICVEETALSISRKTHDALWDETEIGGEMLVCAGAIEPAEISPEAVKWAKGAFS